MIASGGNAGKALQKAGYSRSIQKNPHKVIQTKVFKKEIAPVVEQLKRERQRAIDYMIKKVKKATYRDLIDGMDKTTKNIQLLSGEATERSEQLFSDAEIDSVLYAKKDKQGVEARSR